MTCRRFMIQGIVQGVYFRASTRQEALKLGITGHAINLADGAVEVLACGETRALDNLQRWLAHGPSTARVDTIATEELPCRQLSGFVIG